MAAEAIGVGTVTLDTLKTTLLYHLHLTGSDYYYEKSLIEDSSRAQTNKLVRF